MENSVVPANGRRPGREAGGFGASMNGCDAERFVHQITYRPKKLALLIGF